MPRYTRRHALILGAGKSGIAAAKLILHHKGTATLLDHTWAPEQREACQALGITCLTHTLDTLPEGNYDLVITSPGLPATHPWLINARDSGYAIISELELAATFWKGDTWAITGSKGKSSVVKCLVDTLNQNNLPAVAAGNYGTPLSEHILTLPNAGEGILAITEVSSFQLEFTRTFAPRLAAILNVQPDHLDRHGSLENILTIKRKIFQAQTPEAGCKAFLPWGINPLGIAQGIPLERFGTDVWLDWRAARGTITSKTCTIPLKGYFNNNVLAPAAALIAAMLTTQGLSPEAIARGFETFQPLPHRVQTIGEKNNIRFIDDSKGTSLTATQAALKMCGPNIHLIAGGLLKEDDLDFLEDELDQYAKAAYIIGKDTTPLLNAWRDILPVHDCSTMENAVRAAFAAAQPGDTILLSPGTASFDQYTGMAQRGDHFKTCFEQL